MRWIFIFLLMTQAMNGECSTDGVQVKGLALESIFRLVWSGSFP